MTLALVVPAARPRRSNPSGEKLASTSVAVPVAGRRLQGMPFAMLVVAALFWGTGNVACKTVLEHIGPLTALSCRNVVGLLLLLGFLRFEPGGMPDMRWLTSALCPAVLLAGAALFQQLAYRWTSVTNVSFLVNTCAVLTPLVAWLFLGQRPGWRICLAGTTVLVGAFLMSGISVTGVGLNTGDLTCLGSALFYAGGMVALGYHLGRYGRPLLTSAVQFAVAVLAITPLAVGIEAPAVSDIWRAWPEIIYLGTFSTALACVLVTTAQRHVSASVAAALTSSESVFGASAAFVMLGERLTATGMIGAVLIFGAVGAVALAKAP